MYVQKFATLSEIVLGQQKIKLEYAMYACINKAKDIAMYM